MIEREIDFLGFRFRCLRRHLTLKEAEVFKELKIVVEFRRVRARFVGLELVAVFRRLQPFFLLQEEQELLETRDSAQSAWIRIKADEQQQEVSTADVLRH